MDNTLVGVALIIAASGAALALICAGLSSLIRAVKDRR